MELVNEFTVKAPMDEAWKLLTDLERIAPCLPGAQLTEVEGDVYRGFVKVKVGPITAQFKGQAQFTERDEVNHRGTIKADGRDTGGKGNAAAFIHAHLTAIDAENTQCNITTDLTITGKVAQFGRGALADVSGKLIDQFATNLEAMVLAGDTAPAASATSAPPKTASAAKAASAAKTATAADSTDADGSAAVPNADTPNADTPNADTPNAGTPDSTVRKIEHHGDVKPVDLLEAAGAPIVKRVAPLGALVLTFLILLRWKRRRHR
jgi:uncharacterized protein